MPNDKEAKARIKINKLLEEAGWRFFDTEEGKANIQLESQIKYDDLGEDFDKAKGGFIDFLLVDEFQNPLVVLEAKSEKIEPLFAKEQARKYAEAQKAKYIILSNGNIHYLWNLEQGNPERITAFPTLKSLQAYKQYHPDTDKLVNEVINEDFVVLTQLPNYKDFPEYQDETKRTEFNKAQKLRFLRYYQINAVKSIQANVKEGKKRFLLEMATGTGKTLTAAAVIKLFYKTGNARRILFLVDRLELEGQASKDFNNYLKNDISTVVYKEKRDDWRKAEIVVTTIQSLLINNKYKHNFSPTDFDLIISDEAHRLLGGGNSRALFEYFLGYKLGLTATPKDYLKNLDTENYDDPRELERRMLLDTYTTFGCEQGTPTFRYTLVDGARDKILVQPTVVDARTDVTTKLLSEEGYSVLVNLTNDDGNEVSEEVIYKQRNFERKFFSDETNRVFVQSFLDYGLLDPLSKEFGKSLVFAVSQKHAAKITQLLNEYADKKWAGKYKSDFAVQVTSVIPDSQKMTVDFSNDKLLGFSQWGKEDEILNNYKTSKARVCVTVGMMTTGWDCPNILNLALMRPIFSPTEFIQIKGRGTRINSFDCKFKNDLGEDELISASKETFKLFDFFAVCEYFEEKYQYDQVLKLPNHKGNGAEPPTVIDPPVKKDGFDYKENDFISTFQETQIGYEGMKIDRMFFQKFEDDVKQDKEILKAVEAGNMESATAIALDKYINQSDNEYTIEKLRKSLKIDRKISVKEILDLIFNGNEIKSKDSLIAEEFDKFISTVDVADIQDIGALSYFFTAYLTDATVRKIIDAQDYTELYYNASLPIEDFSRVDDKMRETIPYYIKTYIPFDKFANA
jgi:type I restriction enzyme R subunit